MLLGPPEAAVHLPHLRLWVGARPHPGAGRGSYPLRSSNSSSSSRSSPPALLGSRVVPRWREAGPRARQRAMEEAMLPLMTTLLRLAAAGANTEVYQKDLLSMGKSRSGRHGEMTFDQVHLEALSCCCFQT